MPGWWDRLIGRADKTQDIDEKRWQAFQEAKTRALEQVLGPMHEMVGHAIVPVQVGGNVHMYYFPQTTGTAFATEDFIEPDGTGPQVSRVGLYELVAFTKLPLSDSKAPNPIGGPFDRIERRICAIFSLLWNYARDNALNPRETSEVQLDKNEYARLIFDEFRGAEEFWIEGRRYGLLLCMEVLPSELAFARTSGTPALIDQLKRAGHYPFSDLNRAAVV